MNETGNTEPRDAHEIRRRTRFGPHDAAGGDHAGAGLAITIRIGADGRIYFQDITGALLPVVDALRGIESAAQPALRTTVQEQES